jgi:hypothetical protein
MTGELLMLHRVLDFLNAIGIESHLMPGAKGFLPNIRIIGGALDIDPACPIGDILHEAAHIAIMPARYRKFMQDDIRHAIKIAFEDVASMDLWPDDPLMRAMLQAGDSEATAWAWSAGLHLKLKPDIIIPDSDDPRIFGGQAWVVRQAHEWGDPIGAHGLAAAGWCQVGRRLNPKNPLPKYPELAFWTCRA